MPCASKGGTLHEGQAVFTVKRGCTDNIYTQNELVQGRLKEGKEMYAFLAMCRRPVILFGIMVYGLSCGNLVLRGKCGGLSAVLDGKKSEAFDVEQG